jgi:DNA polymerase-3 subunit alpha
VSIDDVAGAADGLICLTGGPDGLVNMLLKTAQNDKAKSKIDILNNIFKEQPLCRTSTI